MYGGNCDLINIVGGCVELHSVSIGQIKYLPTEVNPQAIAGR